MKLIAKTSIPYILDYVKYTLGISMQYYIFILYLKQNKYIYIMYLLNITPWYNKSFLAFAQVSIDNIIKIC